jgi:hypothetical protein
VSQIEKPGFYRDHEGNWQRDRRTGPDRRAIAAARNADERRRNAGRRKADLAFQEREHRAMIEDALADFAEEHER